MEEEEDHDDEEVMIQPLPLFRFLTRSLLFNPFIMREREEIEDEMIQRAMDESMDSFHQSLFKKNPRRRLVCEASSWSASGTTEGEEGKCFVCLEELQDGVSVIRLPCTHTFHEECIRDVVSHSHGRCPLCRVDIPTVSRSPSPPQPQETIKLNLLIPDIEENEDHPR